MQTRILGTLLAYAATSFAVVGFADTSAQEYTLEIARQPITVTLQEFSKQTGLNVSFVAKDDDQKNLLIGPIKGRYTVESALDELLANSGLTFTRVNAVTIAVTARGGERVGRMRRIRNDSRLRLQQLADRQFVDEAKGNVVDEAKGNATVQQVAAVSGTEDSRQATTARISDAVRVRGMEEVVVTAQKRQERLIDVPQSVAVLSAKDLTKLAATQFRDFANTVPGLAFITEGAGLTRISLRGVTTGFDVSSTVGMYVDDVPFASPDFASGVRFTLDAGLFDIDRIEVLRGPQGTLYGASTMGGLIKYVTKRPDATRFGVDVQTGISDTHHGGLSYNGAVTVNAPIVTDTAALRASGFYSRDGGYFDNLALGQKNVNRGDVYGGRVDLLFTPTDALTIRIGGFLQNISRGTATADYTFAGEPIDGSLDQRRPFPESFDQQFRLASATVAYDLGSATLTSISSYQTVQSQLDVDFSPQFVPLCRLVGRSCSALGTTNPITTDKFVQEVRLAAEASRPLEWLIGGFYTRETVDYRVDFVPLDLAGQPAPNQLFAISIPSGYEGYAAFGDLTWHLTDKFDVTGGARYAHSRQRFEQIASGLLGRSTPTRRSREDVVTYLANARYHFSDHATGYLRYATGYRPGGPNFVAIDPTTGLPIGPPTYEADRLKSYEAGFKGEIADGRFGIDLAAFYIDWDNIIITVSRGGFSGRANAPGGATVQGAELALTARPARAFTVAGAFAYQDAKMSEANPDLGAAKGERLPTVPRFTAALNADYQLPVGGGLQPTVGATLRYVDDRRASFDNSTSIPQYRLPDYTTVDLRAGLTLDRVNVQLYVRNLSDERGELSASTFYGRTAARAAILQPRTIGINATTQF